MEIKNLEIDIFKTLCLWVALNKSEDWYIKALITNRSRNSPPSPPGYYFLLNS